MPEINENHVQVVTDDSPIQYFVSSCLTVTCGFGDGTMIGAHFSQGVREDRWTYDDSVVTWTVFLDTVTQQITAHGPVTWVIVRGDLDGWDPEYLTTQAYQGGYAKRGNLRPTISAATSLNADAIDIAKKTGDILIDAGKIVDM